MESGPAAAAMQPRPITTSWMQLLAILMVLMATGSAATRLVAGAEQPPSWPPLFAADDDNTAMLDTLLQDTTVGEEAAAAAAAAALLDRQLLATLKQQSLWLLGGDDDEDDAPGSPEWTHAAAARVRVKKGTRALLEAHGYPVEEHTVRTQDGYLLGAFRVPRVGRPAVLLMHGLLASSADYVLAGRDKALAPVLFDAGLDVWMCNARGTTPSRRHAWLSPDQDAAFWRFTWHEIGALDLPACVDHVLAATNQSALHYVGHSQGTTTFFVLGSERPEYMAKVRTFTALAPVAFVRDVRSLLLRVLGLASGPLTFLLRMLGVHEFLPSGRLAAWLGDEVCADGHTLQPLCVNLLFQVCGADSQQLNKTLMQDMLVNSPAGASVRQMLHWGQNVRTLSLAFRQFDHGPLGNLLRYGTLCAPEYRLGRVTAPTYLVYSDNDLLSVPSNLRLLQHRLPNVVETRRVALPVFNHIDFLYAVDVKALVYDDLVDTIARHEAEALLSTP